MVCQVVIIILKNSMMNRFVAFIILLILGSCSRAIKHPFLELISADGRSIVFYSSEVEIVPQENKAALLIQNHTKYEMIKELKVKQASFYSQDEKYELELFSVYSSHLPNQKFILISGDSTLMLSEEDKGKILWLGDSTWLANARF